MRLSSFVVYSQLVAAAFALSLALSTSRSCLAAGSTLDRSSSSSSSLPDEGNVAAESAANEHLQPSRYLHPRSDGVAMGCQELTSKRYISDGFCTSVRPITERVCGGLCLPIDSMPWYAEYVKVWARTKVAEWRCVDDETKRRAVTLACENGDTRRYTIRVVTGCRCKQFNRVHNQSPVDSRRDHDSLADSLVVEEEDDDEVADDLVDDATTPPVEASLTSKRRDRPPPRRQRRPPSSVAKKSNYSPAVPEVMVAPPPSVVS